MKVDNTLMQEAINMIKNGIVRKLDAAKKMIEYDKEIAAGIYVYAVEELGKLQVMKNSNHTNNEYIIDYYDEFNEHRVKFPKAFEYFKEVGHPECIYLGKGFSPFSFTGNSFMLALIAETQARLGIFYTDFKYDKVKDAAINLKQIPKVDEDKLKAAIAGFEDIIKSYS